MYRIYTWKSIKHCKEKFTGPKVNRGIHLGIKRLNIIKNGNSLRLICIQLMEFNLFKTLAGFLEKN